MHVDDRLATALRQPCGGPAMARIQFRQILDLLGTRTSEEHSPQIDAAFLRLVDLAKLIPAPERAAILGDQGLRLRNPRLVAEMAQAEPAVAGAAFDRAELTEEQWLDLIPALPVPARGVLRHRRGRSAAVDALLDRLGVADRGLPPVPEAAAATPGILTDSPAIPEPAESARPDNIVEFPRPQDRSEGIGAIVRRIEAFRKTRAQAEVEARQNQTPWDGSPRLPLEGLAAEASARRLEVFDFATDVDGRIAWTESAIAPMAVGLRIDGRDPVGPAQGSPALAAAFRKRQPISAQPLHIDGAPAIAGNWQVDATPRFDRSGGRFIGYHGRMRRPPAASTENASAIPTTGSEADRMRQVLHELKTPINAIQGFAEAIQQQLFGPTPHEYRALAASIAGDAARILAGFEELERLAKLDSGALKLDEGECDLAQLVATAVTRLDAFTAPRDSGFTSEIEPGPMPLALAGTEADRMIWRLLATLAGAAGQGEHLSLHLGQRDGTIRLAVQLPRTLAAGEGDALFEATSVGAHQAITAGMFGTGFALRLAAVEARAAGGSLERKLDELRLTLPMARRPALAEPYDSELLNADRAMEGERTG